jgi:2,3-bisphosphoglycerate-independent phosphoglycerate mutase
MAIAADFELSTLGLHGMDIAGSQIGRCGVQAAGAGIAGAGLRLISTI